MQLENYPHGGHDSYCCSLQSLFNTSVQELIMLCSYTTDDHSNTEFYRLNTRDRSHEYFEI